MKILVVPPGTVFGRLVVIGEAGKNARGDRVMLCQCECGRQATVVLRDLRSGNTKSCGCGRMTEPDTAGLRPGEVPLRGKKAAGRVALVDGEDYDLVMQYKWHVYEQKQSTSSGTVGPYAIANTIVEGRRTTVKMHVLIMGCPYIDHANGNGLDNRRENLRPATHVQNSRNTVAHKNGLSRYKGVGFHSLNGRWRARIKVGAKHISLGVYASEEEAARAYDAAARKYFGEFAFLNFPDEETA
jgi:hypothetical protein